MLARTLSLGSGFLPIGALATALVLAGCGAPGDRNVAPAPVAPATASSPSLTTSATPPVPSASATAVVVAPPPKPFTPSRPDCDTVAVFAAGAPNGSVCVDDAAANGLTVIDLSDNWTPRVFATEPGRAAPEYRSKYLELAKSQGSELGLYGIAPTLSIVAARLTDEKRHACDAAVDLAPLVELRAATKKGAPGKPAVAAAQAELLCAGLLKKASANGTMNSSTEGALEGFRHRHMIVGYGLQDDTLAALTLGGDELELRALLRGLRERVVEAAGLLEDGSASEERALVADRDIDLSAFGRVSGHPIADGAPDLVNAATDRAARALGWTTADGARAFITARGKTGLSDLRVAVALPAAPSYYGKAMELRAEVDRGDVFTQLPGQAAAERRKLSEVRRPSIILYAKDGDIDRPLMRWSTTIGGWKKERGPDGEVSMKYKESDVGDRVWRQILAAPAWLPPDSTPEDDLVSESKDGSFSLKRDLIQPGYRNAYGLVMMIHHEPVVRGKETRYLDHGIRTHGSVDYRSIGRGESHGCHRLENQLALRLSGFLLSHRTFARRGQVSVDYHRTLDVNDRDSIQVDVPTRGYLYELDPPVPVRVLRGRVSGEKQKPMSSVEGGEVDGGATG